jgi:hypothetical protein
MGTNKIKKEIIKNLQESLIKITEALPVVTPTNSKPEETVVTFDKSTNPYEVIFSERGFEIKGTRFSFEFIENALSKDVNIVLDKGKGLILDSIKMNKILKYKDLYSKKQNVN